MARITLVELNKQVMEQDRRIGLITAGLQAAVNLEIEWFARFTLDGTRFKVGVAELARAHGGLLFVCTSVKQSGIVCALCDGAGTLTPERKPCAKCGCTGRVDEWDRRYTTVNYLEDAQRDYRTAAGEVGARMRVEIGRALRMRNEAAQAAQDSLPLCPCCEAR